MGAGQLVVALVAMPRTCRACVTRSPRRAAAELLAMLQYSARAQLEVGALLAVLLATGSYWG